ncbi:MAG: 5-methyltetrahydrofolate--homocysteine methyltransferase [Oscillospiraceae bacterium]|nr:5-methyltetrahydrofolate--homocysteine methyltransferase [Oscillospiraceae bacterium]
MKITEELGKRILFFDGAMGTLLQERGLAGGELPELWNLTHPEVIRDIHGRYLEAGCDILKTNTFGANGVKLKNCPEPVEKVVSAAVGLAREAVEAAGHGYVALDIGPTGKLLKPMGDLAFEDAVEGFARAVRAGAEGADLILIETMSDLYETKAAVLAAKENCGLPIFVTLIFNENGRLLTGGDVFAAAALLEGLGVAAIGLNCGLGPHQMAELFPSLRQAVSVPIVINPNAGLPHLVDGHTAYAVGPREFAEAMAPFARQGAWVLGGCCGTTPAHLAETVAACGTLPPLPLEIKRRTWVSSYAGAVEFGEKPVLIGERINPTGKPQLKKALREDDLDYILEEGITQQENGAQILDVNVGLPELNEAELLVRLIPELQSVVKLPLQIDTANTAAMAAAMRVYNGCPLVNSVSGKTETMEAVFPLVKQYGGAVIALTLDENGIPGTAEERLAIAKRIVETAAVYGIAKENLIFDPLAMTISSDSQSAQITLKALRLIREELGCRTSLGVSNISFGLPQREHINTAFFTMAMQSGLSAAIMNPNSKAMTDAYYAYCALAGLDENCQDYIAACTGQAAPTPAATACETDLRQSIIRGLKENARAAAASELSHMSPLELVSQLLIPALDFVGQEFEAGRLYLPQLLLSAEAAKAVSELVRQRLDAEGGASIQPKSKVILATVKGDIHDIGKNIVKVVMENYGYQILDLGKDVEPDAIVEAALRERVTLVGLSALMTTTVVSMEETIKRLRKSCPDCRVMVGGAVLTEEYAAAIGADFYGKDAMSSVRYADSVSDVSK